MTRIASLALALGASLLTFAAVGCDCAGGPGPRRTCSTSNDCTGTDLCVDGTCVPAGTDAGPRRDGSVDARVDAYTCPAEQTCGASCCRTTELCYGGDTCVLDSGACTTTDDCPGDSYCEPTLMRCIPYGTPPGHDSDPSCSRLVAAGTFSPTVQCAFTAAPAGDAFPGHLHVLSTPMVVDFGIGRTAGSPRRPSIVAVFDDGDAAGPDGGSEQPSGVIRILDGASCAQRAELGSLQLVSASSPPALGDLTGDGRPEIVANQAGGGVVAFTYDDATSAWRVLWRSTAADCTTPYNVMGSGWAGPSLVDLDADGLPEVLRGGIVIGHDGCLIDDASLGLHGYSQGIFGVVADVDADGALEFVAGDGVWQWDGAARHWTAESFVTTGQAPGHVAIADFGDFPGSHGWPAATPEVAVISSGSARVQTLDGTLVFGPVVLPGGGTGGPPTVGDFDGDHRPELASAGANAYSVFDLDCTTGTPIGTCATGATNGVLWSQRSQDQSSNVTGSSIFDFEADGRAEAVYGDECFVRVYDGRDGTVLFSQSRSSCTWYENPVIADVDGDFNAEIVIGDNWNCSNSSSGRDCSGFGLEARNTDPLFAGLRCAADDECTSGHCDSGFCRCTSDAECCVGAGCETFVCEAPPAGTPGTGNTCRASRPIGTLGIRVYRDGADRWVRSRMVWNQHAYFVTNTEEFGQIPATAASNWLDTTLNNFRQNVQGDATPGASPDLTTSGIPLVCDGAGARLTARICNRGTEPVGSGVTVGFYVGDPAAGGTRICDGASVGDLMVGQCEMVQCSWPDAPQSAPGMDIYIVADDGSVAGECREANNITVFRGVYCGFFG
ncbi:MAG: hypothetical protein U0234_11455 [Sandaracinus sp.]